ncbi:hypothetical protein PUR71_25465 [Streptomyces sp. SP17BM10]|uniref:PepSY domain-containing protein n=1 Tax=Streptomyces sp. SP17BM10 TaxID=3002530 RepID=UPI002E792BC5|nr:hypothetical protein [Streptomyces sp. SP17BM10]MEE1786223.1 hypothetical protein [Streptomyces sp. SP17BM10]
MTDSPSSSTPFPQGPDSDPELGPAPSKFGPGAGPLPGAEEVPPAPKRRRTARVRAWAAGQERRIAAGVAAVALVGAAGGVALAALNEGHGGHGGDHGQAMNWSEDGSGELGGRGGHGTGDREGGHGGRGHRNHGGRQGFDGQGGQDGRGGEGRGGEGQTGGAPAPLPSVAASAALEKAQGAVPGGRAESLRRVTAQDGGAAWSVVVLGQDGVRHRVTVDGASGELTGNTVVAAPGR